MQKIPYIYTKGYSVDFFLDLGQ